MSKLLVVDDEQSICWGLSRLGESNGHEVVTASSAEQGLAMVDDGPPDVIVLDVRLPGMDGLTAISRFQERMGSVPVIVITAYGDLGTAVDAIHKGAFDYIVKPFDLEQVERVLERALASIAATSSPAVSEGHVGGLVGKTPAMQEAFKRIALAAEADGSVLISGESGTGKELAARAIHKFSRRADGPFVAVNIASLSPTLIESELFGHVEGAFTGARNARPGLLAQADGGVLFLDEVADIPLPTQVKLLRMFEQGEYLPVGHDRPVRTDFRVVSATHRSLVDRVNDGAFRHDLYFRLCGFQIDMPPLRERRHDIGPLAEHFIEILAKQGGRRTRRAAETLHELQHRYWHGHVRELRNAIEHALVVARGGVILPEHLAPPAFLAAQGDSNTARPDEEIARLVRTWAEAQLSEPGGSKEIYEKLLRVIEPSLIEVALNKHRGQCAPAARTLGLHRTTLRKKLKQYDIGEGSSGPS